MQVGFRLDWTLGDLDTLTLHGDAYDAEAESLVRSEFTLGTLPQENLPATVDLAGYDLLARWQRQLELERIPGEVWHCWHQPAERDPESPEFKAGKRRMERYAKADTPAKMRSLIRRLRHEQKKTDG